MTQTYCILGGSGFVGGHLAARLAHDDVQLRIPSRRRERQRHLLVLPQVDLIQADIHDPQTLRRLFADCDAVINLVGLLNEGRGPNERFRTAHLDLTVKVLDAMRETGVRRLLHMSALGANPAEPQGQYLRTKGEAEQRVLEAADIDASVLKPSVIFGPGDSFFNRFGGLLRRIPLAFPLACPDTRFAPVYVGDVIEAFSRCLADPATRGGSYELCGPDIFRLRELVELTARTLGLRRRVIGLADPLARLQAHIMQRLPGKPFSMDNYHSLQHDSLCHENGLEALGITPHSVAAILPTYLGQQHARARYTRFRQAAGRH